LNVCRSGLDNNRLFNRCWRQIGQLRKSRIGTKETPDNGSISRLQCLQKRSPESTLDFKGDVLGSSDFFLLIVGELDSRVELWSRHWTGYQIGDWILGSGQSGNTSIHRVSDGRDYGRGHDARDQPFGDS
jgi:hypothetical protein